MTHYSTVLPALRSRFGEEGRAATLGYGYKPALDRSVKTLSWAGRQAYDSFADIFIGLAGTRRRQGYGGQAASPYR